MDNLIAMPQANHLNSQNTGFESSKLQLTFLFFLGTKSIHF